MIRTLRFLAPSLVALAALAGCQGNASKPASSGSAAISDRPTVDVTAADLFSWGPDGGATQQLEFYDEMERRPITSQDDAIHAVLLMDNGVSASTYPNRLTVAKARGLLDASYDRPPQEAVTVGEVSVMVARSLRLKSADSPAAAVAELKQAGVIPETASMYHGLTGAQLLALLGAVQDEYGDRLAHPAGQPGPTVASTARAPAAAEREQFDDFISTPAATQPAPTAATVAAAAPAPSRSAPIVIDSRAPRAMTEPLPILPSESRPGKSTAAAVSPVVAAVSVPQPHPQPAAPAATAVRVGTPQVGEWMGGKPLKRRAVAADAKATDSPK
ncbi:MAG: hypothetical protein KF745_07445 [Phycisphaeraceae bacterium]|nr:hypothetical protein [Phycisphaeraceae bacterium]